MIRILQDPGKSPEKEMRYGVYSIQGAIDSGQSFTRSFIVLRNGYGMITRFTRLEQFMPFYQYKAYKPIDSDPGSKLYYVTQMLNYVLVDNGEEFGMVQTGQKKFVSYNEGKDIYSVGLHTFQEIAKEAGAVYHIKRRVLVNTEIVDQYLEAFRDDPI